jgi:hypothetical protein
MAATEELRVTIKTVADTAGAVQASQALKGVQSQAERNSQRLQQLMRSGVSAADALRQINAGIAQQAGSAASAGGAARGAGGRSASAGGLSLGDVAGAASRLAGAGVGLYAVQHVLQGINGYLADSVKLMREYTHATGGFSTQVNALDAAFSKATKSGDALQITIGRLVAPSEIGGLKAQAAAADLVNEKLTGLARFVQEHTSGESLGDKFWKGFVSNLEVLPNGIGQTVTGVRELGKTLEQVDRDDQRRIADRQNARLREINELPSRDTASELARLAYWDQVDAAVRDLTSAQQQQKELQRESVNLAAQEAQIRLSMLPTAERLADAQRDATEAQIRARQAGRPASEALEDLQYEQQRARLIASNRGASVEERTAARRQFRALTRAEPGVALAGLEAGRPVTLAGRAVERVGLEQQLFQITNERALAQITLAQETNSLLAQIAEQRTQAIELTINMGSETFRTEFHAALQVVQGQNPAPIPLVGTGP